MGSETSTKKVRARRQERGVALILVVVAIAVLTAVATEFAYNSRVDLQLATNQRDEVRAYYLARSGIAISRLLLTFQKQVDKIKIPNFSSLLAPPGRAPAPSSLSAQQPSLNLQLWKMARIDCQMLQMMVKQGPFGIEPKPLTASAPGGTSSRASPSSAGPQAQRSFGGFRGCFLATIGDEEEKLNLNKIDAGTNYGGGALVARMLEMFTDKRFEFVFDREDANKVKVGPQDTLMALHDWMDADETQSALNTTGVGDPFTKGFSDENSLYDRYTPRYKVKNAPFDSLDELYMVHGVSDRFMAAFGSRLTVYPDVNAKLNINTDDPLLLKMVIFSLVDPLHVPPQLNDPYFIEDLIRQVRAARILPGFGMSVSDFALLIQAAGVPINRLLASNIQGNQMLSDKSSTFSIKSVGEAGAVQKTISAVVRMDDNGMGRLVHWREE
jgi:general secretion pathway protein K